MNIFWPRKLYSPHIELGISLERGLSVLREFGEPVETRNDNGHSFRVDSPEFDVAIYEKEGIVIGVWYNDPIGRLWSKGKSKKVDLYLQRYGDLSNWDMRQDNGWMRYHFNDAEGLAMVYGVHNDVIRFNLTRSA
ncbi:hypothetical protein AHAT_02550 [Agarivorans sp. Toyoura001]|uniref:hypothetical protein n=1 Tax=Agarivorans sp. Toyoura001 TaxID=2283141 RepID=UPI0010DCCC03|nr:hypothetical protein [Agarivorans sp. Toyoura001]GDY24365.1 hypothetical protein AHAT_02550 [Agarivorans sp. Toyoura001]